MSQRDKAPTMRALLPSRLVPEDILSEWQGPNLPNTKNYAPPPDSMRGRMGDVLSQGIAALGGFTGLPMGGEGSKAALLGELLAAGMPLVGGIKALPGAKVLAGPAWEKALRFYAEAGGLAERHVPRMANALQRAGIKVPARSVAEKVAAHKIVNEALDLAHTPAGPVEGPFATPQVRVGDLQDAAGAYSPTDQTITLDRKTLKNMTRDERASLARHEIAHKAETESGLWQQSDTYLWDQWEKNPSHPIFDWWSEKTGKRGFDNNISPEIIATLYADRFEAGTIKHFDPRLGKDVETPIPAPLMDMLRSIDDKYGIYAKRAKRATTVRTP